MKQKRKRPKRIKGRINDDELLVLIIRGELQLENADSRDPIIMHRGRRLAAYLIPGKNNTRWRVQICRPINRQRSVMRAKMVWMIWNRRIVPRGHQVHHQDLDRHNDHPLNLGLETNDDHKAIHYGKDDF